MNRDGGERTWQGLRVERAHSGARRAGGALERERRIEDHVRVVRDAAGEPFEFTGVWTDTTDRRAAEAKLRLKAKVRAVIAFYGCLWSVFLWTASWHVKLPCDGWVLLIALTIRIATEKKTIVCAEVVLSLIHI